MKVAKEAKLKLKLGHIFQVIWIEKINFLQEWVYKR